MESVYKEVKRRCHADKRVAPSRDSVLKRIRALDARLVARKRLSAKSAESIALSTPGMLEATEALEPIQIEHTLAELRFAHAQLRREAKGSINEEQLFAMYARQQAIITDATKATKAARRRKEPQQRRPGPTAIPAGPIDYSKNVIPLDSELWGPTP